MKICFFATVLLLVHGSDAVTVSLAFNHPRLWLNDTAVAYCTSDTDLRLKDVKAVSLRGSKSTNKVEYSATRTDCSKPEPDTSDFTTVQDTSGNRISLLTYTTIVTFRWVLLEPSDTDFYHCSLTLCAETETTAIQSQNSPQLTVVTRNTAPVLLQPTSDIIESHSTAITVNATCEGYAGYPDGIARVVFEDSYYHINKTKMLTVNSTNGYFNDYYLFEYTVRYSESLIFWCQTENYASSEAPVLKSAVYSIIAEYKPFSHTFVCNDTSIKIQNDEVNITDSQYISAAAPLDIVVTCVADSKPAANVSVYQVSGPDNTVQVQDDGKSARIQVSQLGSLSQVEVKLQCDSKYQSSGGETASKTSLLTVTVTSGVSTDVGLTSDASVTTGFSITTNGMFTSDSAGTGVFPSTSDASGTTVGSVTTDGLFTSGSAGTEGFSSTSDVSVTTNGVDVALHSKKVVVTCFIALVVFNLFNSR